MLRLLWCLNILTRVEQRDSEIGDRGAELLAEGLKVNSSLQELRLVRLTMLICVVTSA